MHPRGAILTSHHVSTDEMTEGNGADWAFATFCDCGWRSPWHHSDAQPGYDAEDVDTFEQARTDALLAAEADAADHLAELDAPPSRETFEALRAPVTDRLGFAAPLTPPRGR